MSSKRILASWALLGAAGLVHCSAAEPREDIRSDAGPSDDAETPDAPSDSSIADSGITDTYEIPDGSVTCDSEPCAVAIAGSYDQTGIAFCALLKSGTLHCWGSNLANRLGSSLDGGTYSSVPRRIDALAEVTSVSLAGNNACATIADGGVWCWGAPTLINAGRDPDAGPPTVGSALPTRLDLVPPSSKVTLGGADGYATGCVATHAGITYCWGNNDSFQLGPRPRTRAAPPEQLSIDDGIAATIVPSIGRTFAVTPSGQLWSWGSGGSRFLLGRDTSEDPDPVPTPVSALSDVRGITSSRFHSCAIAGKFVECWGSNFFGGLGLGTGVGADSLPRPTSLADIIQADEQDAGLPPGQDIPLQIAAGESNPLFTRRNITCAVMGSGRVYCWGANGQTEDTSPRRVEGLSGPAVAVAVADSANCALLRSGSVECWGYNQWGALGRGIDDESIDYATPAPVVFPTD